MPNRHSRILKSSITMQRKHEADALFSERLLSFLSIAWALVQVQLATLCVSVTLSATVALVCLFVANLEPTRPHYYYY